MKDRDYLAGLRTLNCAPLYTSSCIVPMEIININYVVGSREAKQKDFMSFAHQHSFFEAHIPLVGRQTYGIDGKALKLSRADILIIAPGVVHSIQNSSDDLQKLGISFFLTDEPTGELPRQFSTALKIEKYQWLHMDNCQLTLLETTLQHIEQRRVIENEIVLTAALVQLFAGLMKDKFSQEIRPSGSVVSTAMRMKCIERFIRDNIGSTITGQMVAEHMYLSKRQVERIVQTSRGISLKQLVDTLKKEEAIRLLELEEMSIIEVAQALGFSELSSFSRFFRRAVGVSPAKYRNEYMGAK